MFQEILTERLLLRQLVPGDTDALFAYRSDPQVAKYQSWEPWSHDEVSDFIEKTAAPDLNAVGWHQIGIALKDGNTLIGDCGIHVMETEPRIAEIGITIAPASQSKGYATEGLHVILDLLFVTFRKHRVFASVDPDNRASMALMERLGLRKEGHSLQSFWFKDRWADDVVFAMLAAEWMQRKSDN